MKKIILLIIGIQTILLSQINTNYRDTSYTPYSTFIKAIKEYPAIKIVYPVLPDSVNANRNIPYVEYGERQLSLDVFSHSRRIINNPAIILVHGGGWRTGDKSLTFPLALQLANRGYVCVSVEYRLFPEALFPAAIIDVKNSIKWLKKNAGQYNVDTNKIAVLGYSAGGQIASLAGFSMHGDDLEDYLTYPGYSSNVNAIINVDGLLDFMGKGSEEFDAIPDDKNPRSAHKWLGASHLENPEVWRKASPIKYIGENSIPILFLNSSRPRFHAGRDEAVEILKIFGIYHEVHTIENTPYSFWLFHPWFNTTFNLVLNFLEILFGKNYFNF